MIKEKIKEYLFKKYLVSFSKSGDDIQLRQLIKNKKPGTYVDIGCWDPTKASNSYFFYLRGWRGICIDPNPELAARYKKVRPSDTFINCAVGQKEGHLNYYMLDEHNSSMNTFDLDFLKKHHLEEKIKKTLNIPLYNLKAILDEHLKPNERLDFFDIDVEGLDLEVLKSNDWEKYRPAVLVIETNLSIQDEINSEVVKYLEEQDYSLKAKTVINNNLGNLFLVNTRPS